MAHPPPPHLNTAAPISDLITNHGIAWPATAPSYDSIVAHLDRISNAVSPAGEWASAIEAGFSAADCARRSANQRKVLSQVLSALEEGMREWEQRTRTAFPADRLPQTATVLLGIVDMLMLHQRGAQGMSDSVLFHLGEPDISERTARRYGTTRRAWLARQEAWA
ncbi:hypothetical protein JCM8208_006789 [Rhodotorula glutinis]